jgi:hypothetical protein
MMMKHNFKCGIHLNIKRKKCLFLIKLKFKKMKIRPKNQQRSNYYFLIAAFSTIGILFSCSPKQGVAGTKTITAEHLAQGKIIFDNSCGKCHDLPNPTDHTSQDWVGIMNSMAPKAKLNDAQHQMVYDYIVSVK